ncbi:Imm7 family immunity protein [Microbispora sp. CA-135349]|uniref:Imm7 family immunity protein n=1 Tax=Microbispora sp. CA-135349 TaxID=3239953 RepID=UPI003D936CBB
MFLYHGWVTIRETAGLDDDDESLRRQVAAIRRLVDDLGDGALLDLRWMNGTPFLHVGGMSNHRGTWGRMILDLFARVGDIAPGSFGLLYVWDDEDPEHHNEFRVFRLVRGAVTEHADVLLSPAVPTLEDEWDGSVSG